MGVLWAALVLISSSLGAQESSASTSDRLFEYSCDYFGEDGYRGPSSVPLLKPPNLTLYQDGTVIFETGGDFYRGGPQREGPGSHQRPAGTIQTPPAFSAPTRHSGRGAIDARRRLSSHLP